jgi:hypothetical protein
MKFAKELLDGYYIFPDIDWHHNKQYYHKANLRRILQKVISTEETETAKQIADNYINDLPRSEDTVSEIVSDFEDIHLIEERDEE